MRSDHADPGPVRVATYTRVRVLDGATTTNLDLRQRRLVDAASRQTGWLLCGCFYDIGPAHARFRPGLAALLSAASTNTVDVLLVDGVDRLAATRAQQRSLLQHLAACRVQVRVIDSASDTRGPVLLTAIAASGWLG